jgi:hypothetical protein
VRNVLKKDMGLKFAKVKKLTMKVNSIRNLNMRQKCARLMIDMLHEGKRILNIDETWVGQTNYSRSSW